MRDRATEALMAGSAEHQSKIKHLKMKESIERLSRFPSGIPTYLETFWNTLAPKPEKRHRSNPQTNRDNSFQFNSSFDLTENGMAQPPESPVPDFELGRDGAESPAPLNVMPWYNYIKKACPISPRLNCIPSISVKS